MIMGFAEASRMFRDVWSLYRKYAARRLDDTEMEDFTCRVSDIYGKYKTPFAKVLLMAVVEEIERVSKFYEKRAKGE